MARSSTTLQENSTAPDFRLPSVEGEEFTPARLLDGRRGLALVFLRGTWWPNCRRQMAQLESMKGQFEKAGLGIAFVAGQGRRGLLGAAGYFRRKPIFFPYLCDESRDVLRAYGIYRAIALDGIRVARPSVFLIDPERKVRFLCVGTNQSDRLSGEQLLREFQQRFPAS